MATYSPSNCKEGLKIMKTVCNENMCSGCMACIDICPKQAIHISDTLKEYNAIIDDSKCINCNLCHNVCQFNNAPVLKKPIKWYEGWAQDEIRKNSSSGGAATALINSFDSDICSCVFKEGKFIFEFDNGDKEKYSGSKYIKSSPIGVYKEINKRVKLGRKVLFIGLPCQCAAARNFTKDNDNLYTVDLICHGTPSPQLLDMYLKEKGITMDELKNIRFRNKTIFGLSSNEVRISPPRVQDCYTFAFLSSLDYTENCYSCKYACTERVSDITIGDSWGSELAEYEQQKGVSLLLCQTEKGIELVNESGMFLKDVDLDKAVDANHQLRHPSIAPDKRDAFFSKLNHGFTKTIRELHPQFYYKQELKALLVKMKILHGEE